MPPVMLSLPLTTATSPVPVGDGRTNAIQNRPSAPSALPGGSNSIVLLVPPVATVIGAANIVVPPVARLASNVFEFHQLITASMPSAPSATCARFCDADGPTATGSLNVRPPSLESTTII